MTTISEAVVANAVREVLSTADLEKATEASIEVELASKLGPSVSQYRNLIKAQVAKFVQDQIAHAAAGETAGAKRGREVERSTHPAKAAKTQAAADALGIALATDELTRCTVRALKGTTYVDLRKFYEKDGERKPTKKGIMLTASEWSALAAKSGLLVDVREWYDKDGEQKPGSKGVSLSSAELQVLVDHADTISGRLGPQAENAECDAARASAPASSAGTSTAGAADGGPAAGEKLFRLGDDTDKHASVNTFKGRPYINLRQHYPKDGKWLPGKKGISLTVDQFRELQKHAPALSRGLEAKDATVSFGIGDKRKASVSEFKSRTYVNVREFYEKDGALLPGSKGLALEKSHWEVLVARMGELLSGAGSYS